MNLIICPHCKMKVLPRQDGTCPSCGALMRQKAPTARLPREPRSKTPSEHIFDERQEKSVKGKSRLMTRAGIEETYRNYLQEAENITRQSIFNILVPFLGVMVIILLLRPLAINYIAPKMAWAEIDNKYSPYTELFLTSPYSPSTKVQGELYAATIFWQSKLEFSSGIITVAIPIIALITAQRRMTLEATRANRSMRGFKKFFQLGYGIIKKGRAWGRYWPKDFSDGEKKEEFLDIIGRKR